MEMIRKEDITVLTSDFQDSHQLLWSENSLSERVTITKVHVHPGKINRRHKHDQSEQIWIAIHGTATLLLLDHDQTMEFREGDVVRFADGDVHGVMNNMEEEFIYISVTSPPINFRYAYHSQQEKKED
ncbi:MAG: cupin domain-containing protein [Candidatus Merdivicinus sp.]|jgi:quercetin dioxygenase-like cupin family protein